MIIYENSLHLEICLFAILLVFELNKGVLQTVAGPFISNDFTGDDFAESTEDQVKILIYVQSEMLWEAFQAR